MLPALLLALPALPAAIAASSCPDTPSCPSSSDADSCCQPTAGLFVFRQRFEPDVGSDSGSWGIDGLDVLDHAHATAAHAPKYTHEEIGSMCARSGLWTDGFDEAEGQWAQSEVGEGVEEAWERSWNTNGRLISTLAETCVAKAEQPALFFHTLSILHKGFPTAQLLADADITPSADTSYSLSELVAALAFNDHKPILSCDNTTLSTVQWPLVSRGPFQSGNFAASSLSVDSNCPAEGVMYVHTAKNAHVLVAAFDLRYPPSTARPATTSVPSWDPILRPTPRPITLAHDESRQYRYPDEPEGEGEGGTGAKAKQLRLFKTGDELREAGKEGLAERKWSRDEL